MALTINKAPSDVSKLEPLDGTNYRRWSQKLLIFFKHLDVDYVLFFELTGETNTYEISIASGNGIVNDNSKAIDEATTKKFQQDNKTIRMHPLNHMITPPTFHLQICQDYMGDVGG